MLPQQIRNIADECHIQLGFPYNGFLELYTKKIEEQIALKIYLDLAQTLSDESNTVESMRTIHQVISNYVVLP